MRIPSGVMNKAKGETMARLGDDLLLIIAPPFFRTALAITRAVSVLRLRSGLTDERRIGDEDVASRR